MTPDLLQESPTLGLISPDGRDITELARDCGWVVQNIDACADAGEASVSDIIVVDLCDGEPPEISFPPDPNRIVVAVVNASVAQHAAVLDMLGVTQILSWPTNRDIFAATMAACVRTRTKVHAGSDAASHGDGIRERSATNAQDKLTGLMTRAAARNWLDKRLSGESAGAVTACLLIGISQFASINAAYGQLSGDVALARVAERIVDFVRASSGEDALVARMGGPEFLVAIPAGVLADENDVDPQELARLLLADVSRPFVADEKVMRLTARCGIALPTSGDDASRLLRRASAALAEARHSATQDIVVSSGVRRRGADRSDNVDRLHADLRLAIDAGEIGIVYQPQYDSHSDRIIGVEALARWNHPELGQLDAGTLFEAADRSDYLLPLSLHIQRLALEQAGRWSPALDDIRLAINVTAADLAQENFLANLLGMIEESGFPAHRVTVEITETGLIENIEQAADLLLELRRRELRVAIDDFGTGYSSLAYLKALHPDYLKIDYSLSRDILGTPRDRVILRAIIAMARSLALTVIAEGVESEEQLTLLAREGCDIYQGFLRSPAVTSEELAALIERGG